MVLKSRTEDEFQKEMKNERQERNDGCGTQAYVSTAANYTRERQEKSRKIRELCTCHNLEEG